MSPVSPLSDLSPDSSDRSSIWTNASEGFSDSLPTVHYTDDDADSGELHSDDLSLTDQQFPAWSVDYDFDGEPVVRYRLNPHQDFDDASTVVSVSQQPPKQFNIVQWNVNGLHSRTSVLLRDLRMGDYAAALLQECNRHYDSYVKPHLPGYKVYADDWGKTMVVVRKEVPVVEIPLQLGVDPTRPQNAVYATAVLVKLRRHGTLRPILLMSVYRSPSGSSDVTRFDKYLKQCRLWIASHLSTTTLSDWLVGGDFNASHHLWGARRGTARSNRDGARMAAFLDAHPDRKLLNSRTNQPTRFCADSVRRTIKLSWLDLTLSSSALAEDLTWSVDEVDKQSDHYQLHISLPADWRDPDLDLMTLEETMWKLRNEPELWQAFERQLQQRWPLLQSHLRSIQTDFRRSTADRIDSISACVERLYHEVAQSIFGRKSKREIWKRWIPKRAQFHSIQFHRFYRRFVKKRHKTHSDWRIYETLRRNRDYWMTYYKHQWLAKNFNECALAGKDPWKVMNEARDMNDHRGRRIPTIRAVDSDDILATTTREKVELINRYYHRFRDNATLPPHWCWPRPTCMPNRFLYYGDELNEFQMHRDFDPELVHPEPDLLPADDERETHDDRYDRYAHWIKSRTQRRWLRCRSEHRYWLSTLNARITSAEVRRAIGSFKNGKAQGPDEVDIQFLKRTGEVSRDIVLYVSNLMFKDWQVVPSRWKERWIIPLIKTGKVGDRMKELRPVSLTSYIAKVLEKILVFRLSTYVLRLQLLSSVHFAYLRGRSTTDCLVYMLDRIQRNMQQRINTHCIYFDFSSAFDTVQHSILLWKLEHQFFIKGPFLAFLAAFLRDRRSCVKLHGICSEWIVDRVGVPQGGALSPLIYILYVDDLGVLNQIRGLHVAIFSDDLALWTSVRAPAAAQRALQEGIHFTQWFCRLNGLIVNHDKTEYKVFRKGRLRDDDLLRFKLEGALEPTRDGTMVQTRERDIAHNPEPIRYLGFWLDTNLNFSAHAAKVRRKVLASWAPIHRNFHRLWHVRADLLWNVYDACCFSIFDYSAVLWPMMLKKDQTSWIRLYRRIVRSCLQPTRGTPRLYQYLQFGTYPLPQRMDLLVTQYYSRMLRTPRTSQLHRVLRYDWWDYFSGNWEPLSVRTSRVNTVIWHIHRLASVHANDDFVHMARHAGRCLDDIPTNLSHYTDLTHQWQQIRFDDAPFTDMAYRRRWRWEPCREILLFTDGSVRCRAGGYGSHLIHGSEYIHTVSFCGSYDFYASHAALRSRVPSLPTDRFRPLSNRCSIDFCESMAIHDGLHSLQSTLSTLTAASPAASSSLNLLHRSGIHSLRIVSDNLTVLKWITGEYKMSHPNQKQLIEEIRWCCSTLAADYDIDICFQWTRSHTDQSRGNDHADSLAKQGQAAVRTRDARRDPRLYDEWSYYHMRAVLNRCKRSFDSQMERDLATALRHTTYGTAYRNEWRRSQRYMHQHQIQRHPARSKRDSRFIINAGIPWTDFFKQELPLLSRDSMRILLGLRSGHNHLHHYMHSLLRLRPDSLCFCGASGQDLDHLLEDCDDSSLLCRRFDLQQRVLSLYQEAWRTLQDQNVSPHWTPSSLDLFASITYLFPPYDVPLPLRGRILYEIVNFYRWVIGYRSSGVRVERHASVYSSDSAESVSSRDSMGIG